MREIGIELVQRDVTALHDVGALAERVIHEEAADQVAAVAQTSRRHAVRQQQQARVLDCAAAEHVRACPDSTFPAVERTDVDVADVRAVLRGLQVGGVGVQQQQRLLAVLELVPERMPEPHRGGVVQEELAESRSRDR